MTVFNFRSFSFFSGSWSTRVTIRNQMRWHVIICMRNHARFDWTKLLVKAVVGPGPIRFPSHFARFFHEQCPTVKKGCSSCKIFSCNSCMPSWLPLHATHNRPILALRVVIWQYISIHFHTFLYVITHCISKKNMHACLAISSAQGIFQGLARPARLHSWTKTHS